MSTSWQEAIHRAIQASENAEEIAADPKTPVGARVIAYAHVSSGWGEIAYTLVQAAAAGLVDTDEATRPEAVA